MSKSKGTKRSLLASLTSLLLCVAMLIGSTFAWFTDTASTAVNKIQAGNLDVELWKGSTDEALGTAALKWVKADGHGDETVLWEPGATYNLESFRIKNNGDLDLKYKVIISGLVGNAKLLEAIDFTVSVNGDALVPKDGTSSVSTVASLNNFEGTLEAGAVTGAITIKGHMKEEAGNEYQGLSIDGIGITVIATQAQGEYDSVNNTYDADAQYPVYVVQDVTTTTTNGSTQVAALVTVQTTETVSKDDDAAPVAQAKVAENTVLEAGTTQVKLSIKDVAASEANVMVATADTQAAKTLEVKLEGLSTSNTTPVIVTMYVGKDLNGFQLYHTEDNGAGTESTQMTSVNSVDLVKNHNEYYYDRATGFVTMATNSFSPFTYVYLSAATDAELAAATDTSAKTVTISSAKLLVKFAQEVNSDEEKYAGYTIKLTSDIDLGDAEWTPIHMAGGNDCVVTFDGGNHTISNFEVNADGVKNVGLFGVANFSTVENLTVVNATVTGINHVGAIVGHGMVTTVKNCTVKDSTITTCVYNNDDGDKAGAVIGWTNEGVCSIEYCTVEDCTITGYRDIAGLVGFYGTTGGVGSVIGNTVKNTTVTQNLTEGYEKTAPTTVGEIVGRSGEGFTLDTNSNTATNVTVNVPSASTNVDTTC